jgi:hypothetical protein
MADRFDRACSCGSSSTSRCTRHAHRRYPGGQIAVVCNWKTGAGAYAELLGRRGRHPAHTHAVRPDLTHTIILPDPPGRVADVVMPARLLRRRARGASRGGHVSSLRPPWTGDTAGVPLAAPATSQGVRTVQTAADNAGEPGSARSPVGRGHIGRYHRACQPDVRARRSPPPEPPLGKTTTRHRACTADRADAARLPRYHHGYGS